MKWIRKIERLPAERRWAYLPAFILLIVILLVLVYFSENVLLSPEGEAGLERALPSSATKGVSFGVVLSLDVNEANLPGVLGVEEFVPAGWQVSGVSHRGKIMDNRIEWLFLNGVPLVPSIEDSALSYTIIPNSLSGEFSGGWISGDSEGNTTGGTSLAVSEAATGGSGGGGGGGGSTGGIVNCTPEWRCSLGPCINGEQKTICVKANDCSSNEGMPGEQAKSCYTEIRTNRTAIIAPPIASSAGRDYTGWIIWLILAIVIFIIGIIFLIYNARKKKRENLMARAREIVMEYRKQGYSGEQIADLFRERNWGEEDIKKVLYHFDND